MDVLASQVAAARFTERIITSVDARTIDEKSLVVLGTSDHLVIQVIPNSFKEQICKGM